MKIDRRDFLKLAGIGGVIFASGLDRFGNLANTARAAEDDFFSPNYLTHTGDSLARQ